MTRPRAVVLAAVVTLTLAGCSDEGDEAGAEVACEDFVKDRLKSPGSADFTSATTTQDGDDTWTVRGDVDSENSFGASLRTSYVCTVTYKGDDAWTLVDLESTER